MGGRRREKLQSTLTFTPLPASDPARAMQPKAIRDRAAAVTLSVSPSPRRTARASVALPTPRKSSQNDSWLGSSPTSRRTRSTFMGTGSVTATPTRKKAGHNLLEISDDSESDATQVGDSLASEELSGRSRKRPIALEESNSDEDVVMQPAKRARRSGPHLDESDSDEVVVQSARKAKRSIHQIDSDSDEVVTHRARQTRKSQETLDSESDDPITTRTRRTVETPPRRPMKAQDRDDLEEDLDFLKSSDTPSTTRRTATSKHSVKQKALEALKQRRAHQQRTNNPGSNDPANGPVDDSDQRDYEEIDSEEIDSDLEPSFDPQEVDMDQDDDDFIVEDDDGVVGAPVDLPFEFSRFQTMKAQDLFKYAVEWMVHKKINPAFAMTDDVYRITFQRLDDYVKGMGGSKFQSSAWTSEFLGSLKARPVIHHDRFVNSGLDHGRCDACNRSGHPATWEVRFTGNTYDRDSLEEDSDDDTDDEDGSGRASTKTYYIGKFCMQNARTAHALAHWRYHLNQWVVDYLKEQGHLTAAKIVERDGWSMRKRRKYANKVADKMEEEGEVKRLHRDFRHETSTAQFANDYY